MNIFNTIVETQSIIVESIAVSSLIQVVNSASALAGCIISNCMDNKLDKLQSQIALVSELIESGCSTFSVDMILPLIEKVDEMLTIIYRLILVQRLTPNVGVNAQRLQCFEQVVNECHAKYTSGYNKCIERLTMKMNDDLKKIAEYEDAKAALSKEDLEMMQMYNSRGFKFVSDVDALNTECASIVELSKAYRQTHTFANTISKWKKDGDVSDALYVKMYAHILRKYRELCVHVTTHPRVSTCSIPNFKFDNDDELYLFPRLKQFILDYYVKDMPFSTVTLSQESEIILKQAKLIGDVNETTPALERFVAYCNHNTNTIKNIIWKTNALSNWFSVEFA